MSSPDIPQPYYQPDPYGQPSQWSPPPPPPAKKKGGVARWLVPVGIGVVALLLGIGIGGAGSGTAQAGSKTPAKPPATVTATTTQNVTATVTATPPPPTATVTETFTPQPVVAFEDGQYLVPSEVVPGNYHTDGGPMCYYELLRNLDGGIDGIIDNDNFSGPTTIQVGDGVAAIKTNGGCSWSKVG